MVLNSVEDLKAFLAFRTVTDGNGDVELGVLEHSVPLIGGQLHLCGGNDEGHADKVQDDHQNKKDSKVEAF